MAETIEINEKKPDLISVQKNANKINRVRKYFELSKLNKLLRWSLFFFSSKNLLYLSTN